MYIFLADELWRSLNHPEDILDKIERKLGAKTYLYCWRAVFIVETILYHVWTCTTYIGEDLVKPITIFILISGHLFFAAGKINITFPILLWTKLKVVDIKV